DLGATPRSLPVPKSNPKTMKASTRGEMPVTPKSGTMSRCVRRAWQTASRWYNALMSQKISELLAADAATAKRELDALTPDELLAPTQVVSPDDALLVKAALYLKHGFLDASHK